jgi:hypothetical protein
MSLSKHSHKSEDGVMVGSMYFIFVTALFLAQPPTCSMTWNGAPMVLAAEAAPLRRPCDVHLKPGGGEAPMALFASSMHAERAFAAHQSDEFS